MKSRGGAPFGRRILETDPNLLKFIYSEKATKFCEISTIDLSYEMTVEIFQNFVAFSEYMNFKVRTMFLDHRLTIRKKKWGDLFLKLKKILTFLAPPNWVAFRWAFWLAGKSVDNRLPNEIAKVFISDARKIKSWSATVGSCVFFCVYLCRYVGICYALTSSPWIFDFHKSLTCISLL